MTNHHLIKLKPHPSAYTANKVTGETIVKLTRHWIADNRLCYNCGRAGHIGHHCRSRGCFKCKGRNHTSICDQNDHPLLTVYAPSAEETLPAIIPVKINGTTLWAYLDTGSGRNFISLDALRRLKINPVRHETRQIVTLSGTQKQSMPIFDLNRFSGWTGKRADRSHRS